MKLKLTDKKQETLDCHSFIFEKKPDFNWIPGQFTRIVVEDLNPDDRGNGRFFSISAAPSEEKVMITTRIDPEKGSSFKKYLFDVSIGTEFEFMDPRGSFILPENSLDKKYCLIAGGIGITPFRSMLTELASKGKLPKVDLLYANRNENNIPFNNELGKIAQNFPEFKIHLFTGDQKIDDLAIKTLISKLEDTLFYLSGPEPMVESLTLVVQSLGIKEENIKTDYFPGYTWP